MLDLQKEIQLTLERSADGALDDSKTVLQEHLRGCFAILREELRDNIEWHEKGEQQEKLPPFPWNKEELTALYAGVPISRVPISRVPMTLKELLEGGWHCKEISEDSAEALQDLGLRVYNAPQWGVRDKHDCFILGGVGDIVRSILAKEAGRTEEIFFMRGNFYEALKVAKKPLSPAELKRGEWWCADVHRDCAEALQGKGLGIYSNIGVWGLDDYVSCNLSPTDNGVTRNSAEEHEQYTEGMKEIYREGDDFYWVEDVS